MNRLFGFVIEVLVIACLAFPFVLFAHAVFGQELREETRLGSVTFGADGVMHVRTEKVIMRGDEVITRENHRKVYDPADDFASEVKAELYEVAPMGIPVETFVDAMWTPTNIAERRKIRGKRPDGEVETFDPGRPTPQADLAREPALGSPFGNPRNNPSFVENAEIQGELERRDAEAKNAIAEEKRLEQEDKIRLMKDQIERKMRETAPAAPVQPSLPREEPAEPAVTEEPAATEEVPQSPGNPNASP